MTTACRLSGAFCVPISEVYAVPADYDKIVKRRMDLRTLRCVCP